MVVARYGACAGLFLFEHGQAACDMPYLLWLFFGPFVAALVDNFHFQNKYHRDQQRQYSSLGLVWSIQAWNQEQQ